MKKYLLILPLLVVGGYFGVRAATPCIRPMSYTLGTIDPRFNLSQEEFLSAVKQAEGVWDKALKKELLVYKPKNSINSIKINLVYDERQANTDKNKELQSQINSTKESAESIKREYSNLQISYTKATSEYKQALSEYQKKEKAYNTEVDYFNARGGAGPADYSRLEGIKKQLIVLSAALENKRLEVNNLANQINTLIKKYNYLVDEANGVVETINQTAGKEFNEGEYVSDISGRRINIYEFESRAELIRVLTHEFGHALGLEHNSNADSIMYYLNQSTNLVLTKEDLLALKKSCGLK